MCKEPSLSSQSKDYNSWWKVRLSTQLHSVSGRDSFPRNFTLTYNFSFRTPLNYTKSSRTLTFPSWNTIRVLWRTYETQLDETQLNEPITGPSEDPEESRGVTSGP